MSKPKNLEPINPTVARYYDLCRELISQIGGPYGKAYKLRENLLDENTKFKVEHVLEQFYGGSMQRLHERISSTYSYTLQLIEQFDYFCKLNDIMQIKNPDAFIRLMLEKDRRDFFKSRFKFYEKRNILISLANIEREYERGNH